QITNNKSQIASGKSQAPNGKYQKEGIYKKEIDFDELEKGTDLWLFFNTTNFGKRWNDLAVLLTSQFRGDTWYEMNESENKLTIFGKIDDTTNYSLQTKSLNVSYRLSAPRIDNKKWDNTPKQKTDTYIDTASFKGNR
ncbi:MAG: hypothetical protein ABEI53_00005, partial [Candidatus Magasanikbacteria bacterium]